MDFNNINQKPLVSIVVATYRRDKDLVRALDSIANLNYTNYEVVLIDDNDDVIWNDKVEQIVNDFSLLHSDICVKYFANHPNQGSAKTRNFGIDMSEGEYVCFLDDDDLYLPKRICNQLYPMIEVNADYSITDLALYYEKDKLIEVRKRDYIKETTSDKLFQYHLMYHMTGTDTLMFRKDYLEKIGKFDPIDVGDEFYLMSKAILGAGKFIYVATCDIKAYVHSAGGGISSGEAKIDGENRLYEYKTQYFDKFENKVIKYIKMRHHMVIGKAYAKKRNWCSFVREGIIVLFLDWKSCLRMLIRKKGY